MAALKPRPEKFAQLLARGIGQSDAYKEVYPKSQKWKPAAVYVKACEMAAKVAGRLEELRAVITKNIKYEVEDALADCDKAMEMATAVENPSAYVAATQLKSRLMGLLVEDRRNERAPLQDLTDEQLDRYAARLDERAASITGPGTDQAGTRTTH